MSLVRPQILTAFLPFLAWCQNPGLVYSRVLPVLLSGNTGSGVIGAIAVDAAGNAYLAGSTENAAFPVTPGAPQTTFGGGTCTAPTYNPLLPPTTCPCDDAFVLELDPHGNVVFATYLGGPDFDQATGIAVDSAGNIYVAGTAGRNFPTTPGSPFGDSTTATTFLAKINPATGLVYSYLIPGLNGKVAVALDAQGNAYFAGSYWGFAATPGALQGKGEIVVGKLNPAGTKLVYAAQFGGSNGVLGDSAAGIAVDSSGNAYIAGATDATDFPVTTGAFQTILPDRARAAFVAKLNASGSALVYATYLGALAAGDLEAASQIRVDAQGEAYVLGVSDFTAFLNKIEPDGSGLVFSTSLLFSADSFDIDTSGNAFLTAQAGPWSSSDGGSHAVVHGRRWVRHLCGRVYGARRVGGRHLPGWVRKRLGTSDRRGSGWHGDGGGKHVVFGLSHHHGSGA
jgi:hypothetical protein